MNSDLDCAADDDEEEKAPEPPLRSLRFFDALESSTSNSTLTVTTNTKNPSESFLDHSTELPEYSYRGDDLEDGDGGGYDSDRIDPDLEELLYASVHHQTTDTMELSYVNGSDPQTVNDPKSNNKNNNNPQESEHLIPQSDAPNSQCIIFNNRRVAKKDLKRLKKVSSTPNLTSSRPSFTESQLDLSFGNISSTTSVMVNTTTSVDGLNPFAAMMSKFYNEDSYDSEEEFRKKARMSKDKRFWKVDQEDLMAGFGRRSLNQPRFGRAASPKKPCRACGGFGHLVKECPRKLICNICGSSKHSGNRCRERVCAICFEPGHQSHKCPVRYDLKQLNCSVCKLVGHTGNQCTLNWRKFLNITDPAQYEEMMKQNVIHEDTVTFNDRISCYNCAETGRHFAFECPQKTMDNLRYQIPPPVANWKALRKGRNSAKSSNQNKTPKRKTESTPRRSFQNVPSPSPSTSTPYFSIPSSTESSSGASTPPPNNRPQPKGSKRPLNGFSKYPESSSSEPEIIQISSDDDDSADSMDYVLNLLKKSTEVNDEPMNGSKSYTPKRNNKKARASYADSLMHLNVSLGSKKKKKDKRLEQQAKEEKKRARIQYNKRNYQGQKVQRGDSRDKGPKKDKNPKSKSPRNKSPNKKPQKTNNKDNQTPKIKNVSNKRKSNQGQHQAGPSGSASDNRSNKTKKRATYRNLKKARSAT